MTRTPWPRTLLIVLVLSSFTLPASAALRPARAEQKPGIFAVILHGVVTLLSPLEKLGPGTDPLGDQGKTPPAPTSSGGDLGSGMDPLAQVP